MWLKLETGILLMLLLFNVLQKRDVKTDKKKLEREKG